MVDDDISHAELLRVLDYDPQTGQFTWKVRTGSRIRVGDKCGTVGTRGAIVVRVHKKLYYAGRLALFYVNGEWPQGNVAFDNGDITDIRFDNLKVETNSELARRRKQREDTLSGVRGVTRRGYKWVAYYNGDYTHHYLGTFETKEEAVAARRAAEANPPIEGGTKRKAQQPGCSPTYWVTQQRLRKNPGLIGLSSWDEIVEKFGAPFDESFFLARSNMKKPLALDNAEWRQSRHAEMEESGITPNRAFHMGRKFGLSSKAYMEKFKAQNGVCAICKKPEDRQHNGNGEKWLAVDHNHTTGDVRGLLCHRCNAALGLLDDDPGILRSAAEYIKSYEKESA